MHNIASMIYPLKFIPPISDLLHGAVFGLQTHPTKTLWSLVFSACDITNTNSYNKLYNKDKGEKQLHSKPS